jgi:hypothetical protein
MMINSASRLIGMIRSILLTMESITLELPKLEIAYDRRISPIIDMAH